MVNIFIIHGTYGHPDENWFPWLKEKLENQGHNVFIPEFPTPEEQTLDNWTEVFDDYLDLLNEDSIVIGHSLGPAFLLSVLEKIDIKIKATFFVSSCIGLLGNEEFDELNKSFVDKDFDWKKIKESCRKFYMFHSKDDPYVPLEMAKSLARKLDANLTIMDNAGHFNEDAGYTEFELLLEKIENEL